MQEAFLNPMLRSRGGPFELINTRSGQRLADHLAGAFDSKSRRTGLLGREGLDEGHALIIAPTNAIHTFFMRFPIDVAFVRRDGQVVGLRHALKPWRVAVALRAYATIELPAGTLARTGTKLDDGLRIAAAR